MKGFSLSKAGWAARGTVLLAIAVVLALTRWPLAPTYLSYFDNINFALALEHFNPALHQPQPPGYPLFVGLNRIVHWLIADPRDVMLVSGILGGAIALLLLWWLGEKMFGPRAGAAAALLLVFNPVFWMASLTNQVRVFLATAGVAAAFAAWRVWQGEDARKWFYTCALLLGLGAGFRPALLVFLLPLLAVVALRSRRTFGQIAVAGAILSAAVSTWLLVTMLKSGGPVAYYRLVASYLTDQSQNTSLLFQASAASWWGMAATAVVWNGLGVLSWIWAAPSAFRHSPQSEWRRAAPFLAWWFVPAFLFHALVHIGEPGHALATVPVLCLIGGWALSKRRYAAWTLALTLNIVLFFRPVSTSARASTYRMVKYADRTVTSTVDALRELRSAGPILIVANHPWVSWRHVSYYFRNDPVLVLPPRQDAAASPWFIQQGKVDSLATNGSEIVLPAEGKLVWLQTPGEARGIPLLRHGSLAYVDAPPGAHLQIGGYSFLTQPAVTTHLSNPR